MPRADVLLGVAFGDTYALGWEFSFPPPRAKWLSDVDSLKPVEQNHFYCYSDDTEMTLILAEHLLEHGGLDQDLFAAELASKVQLGSHCRFYGSTTTSVLMAVKSGRDWREASRSVNSYGNGAAIRVSPIPVFYSDFKDVLEYSLKQAEVTHSHPLGVEGAQIIALAIHYSLKGVEPADLPERILESRSWQDVYREKLSKISDLLDETPYQVFLDLGNDSRAQNSVPTALFCHVKSGGSVLGSVLCAISVGGDTDSIASMAAAISAAYGGLDVDENMLEKIEDYERIKEISTRLL